ncbi:MAG: hypothetical protein ACKN85_00265 [Pirellula sp.]
MIFFRSIHDRFLDATSPRKARDSRKSKHDIARVVMLIMLLCLEASVNKLGRKEWFKYTMENKPLWALPQEDHSHQ